MSGSAEPVVEPRSSVPAPQLQALLLEAAAIAAVGLTLGLIANGVSPRGLVLSRDYFPPTPVQGREARALPSGDRQTAPGAATAKDRVLVRLAELGLPAVDFAGARALFEDPRHAQELIVFVDARNDAAYTAGHIPGAYQFDRYYPERFFPTVLPVCDTAELVVVYCTGGDCEDSEFAARALLHAGVARERLRVFAAGMDEWRRHGMPVEVGPRGSGDFRPQPP